MRRRFIIPLFILLLLSLLVSACGPKATTIPPLNAALSELQGTVLAKQSGQADFTRVSGGFVLQQNGQLQTGDDGRVRLDLSTGTIIRISHSSLFTLVSNTPNSSNSLSSNFKLDIGQIFIILNSGSADVQTPSGVASVRGSYLMVQVVEGGGVKLTCLEGNCNIKNDSGDFPLTTGQSAFILNANTAPFVQTMSDAEVQQWLNDNPEATVVVPTLTAPADTNTPEATATKTEVTPTDTSEPTATDTAAPTATSVTPTDTPVYYPPPAPTKKPADTPTPTATPNTNALTVYISNFDINQQGRNVHVQPGGKVTVRFIYLLWNQSDCAGCIDQLVVGLDNGQVKTGYGCGYSGIPGLYPGTGPNYHSSSAVTFSAPDVPGSYPVGISLLQYYDCSWTPQYGALPYYGGGIYGVYGSITIP
jgi:hypothetical protein